MTLGAKRGPVGRCTSQRALEDLQVILGAANVNVAALKLQDRGYSLLLAIGVVYQPGGFVSRSADLGSPPLVVTALSLGVSPPGPQSIGSASQ